MPTPVAAIFVAVSFIVGGKIFLDMTGEERNCPGHTTSNKEMIYFRQILSLDLLSSPHSLYIPPSSGSRNSLFSPKMSLRLFVPQPGDQFWIGVSLCGVEPLLLSLTACPRC